LFPLAENNLVLRGEKNGFSGDFRKQEWCGATFTPDGRWLLANIQTPGLTVAITGPWGQGPL
jgi:secreted PhoX family phosphatase